jgi:serralysin
MLHPRSPHRRAVLVAAAAVALAVLCLGMPAPAATADPWAAEEQQFVYELNQARWNPTTVEAAAGLAPGAIVPRPPLAVNAALATAADSRSGEMAEFGYFAHQSPITGDWPNAVARHFGYPLPANWLDDANNVESIQSGGTVAADVLQSFVNSEPHRLHVMGQGGFTPYNEIGVGTHLGAFIWTVMTAADGTFGVFLTGVAYADANDNHRLDLGEGLAGVTVTAGSYSTSTSAAGGWSLRVPAGRYRVTASGTGFAGTAVTTVRVGGFNIGIDFLSGLRRPQVHAFETCLGLEPTILGTGGNDRIKGTPGDDVIVGGGGRDTISGGAGDDVICGGYGNDTLIGGPGNDALIGGPGSDACLAGEDNRGCESS